MVFRGIVKNYTVDLILWTKFKKIIGMKETFAQNMEVQVSLMEFLLQTQGSFGGFLFEVLHFTMFFRHASQFVGSGQTQIISFRQEGVLPPSPPLDTCLIKGMKMLN